MNFTDFIIEASKQEGNRLPLKSFKSIKKKNETGHAADDSPIRAKAVGGRKRTVKQPEGHEAAKRNQAYGGESEEQYNPPKYRKITKDLRKNGGQVMVPGKPPYSAQRRKPDNVVKGAELGDKIDKVLKAPGGNDAVENLKKKGLENAFKKDAKGHPKLEEEATLLHEESKEERERIAKMSASELKDHNSKQRKDRSLRTQKEYDDSHQGKEAKLQDRENRMHNKVMGNRVFKAPSGKYRSPEHEQADKDTDELRSNYRIMQRQRQHTAKQKDNLEKAHKKDAKGHPKLEEERMDFTEFLESATSPLYEKEGEVPKCPPGYKYDVEMKMCVPKTKKDGIGDGQKSGNKDMKPGNGAGYNVWGNSGYSGAGYAWEEQPTSHDLAGSGE